MCYLHIHVLLQFGFFVKPLTWMHCKEPCLKPLVAQKAHVCQPPSPVGVSSGVSFNLHKMFFFLLGIKLNDKIFTVHSSLPTRLLMRVGMVVGLIYKQKKLRSGYFIQFPAKHFSAARHISRATMYQ